MRRRAPRIWQLLVAVTITGLALYTYHHPWFQIWFQLEVRGNTFRAWRLLDLEWRLDHSVPDPLAQAVVMGAWHPWTGKLDPCRDSVAWEALLALPSSPDVLNAQMGVARRHPSARLLLAILGHGESGQKALATRLLGGIDDPRLERITARALTCALAAEHPQPLLDYLALLDHLALPESLKRERHASVLARVEASEDEVVAALTRAMVISVMGPHPGWTCAESCTDIWAVALVELGARARGVAPQLAGISTPEALLILGSIGPEAGAALPVLEARMAAATKIAERCAIAATILRIDPGHDGTLEVFLEWIECASTNAPISSSDSHWNNAWQQALPTLDARAAAPLARILETGDPTASEAALRALLQMKTRARSAAPAILAHGITHVSRRAHTLFVMAHVAPDTPEALELAFTTLADDPKARSDHRRLLLTIFAAAPLAEPRVIDPILDVLALGTPTSGEDHDLQRTALAMLVDRAALGDRIAPRLLDIVTRAQGTCEPIHLARAVAALVTIAPEDTGVRALLAAWLEDGSSPPQRVTAAALLAHLGEPEARWREPLENGLAGAPSWQAERLGKLLAEIGDPRR